MLNNLKRNTKLLFGKIRRVYLSYCRKKYTLEKIVQRSGECKRCGSCCKLLFKCPFFQETENEARCLIYKNRSLVCRFYPIDERDVEELKRAYGKICGFHFNNKNSNGNGDGRIR